MIESCGMPHLVEYQSLRNTLFACCQLPYEGVRLFFRKWWHRKSHTNETQKHVGCLQTLVILRILHLIVRARHKVPSTRHQPQETRHNAPGAKDTAPSNGHKAPGTAYITSWTSEIKHHATGSMHQAPSNKTPGTIHQSPGTRHQTTYTRHQAPGTVFTEFCKVTTVINTHHRSLPHLPTREYSSRLCGTNPLGRRAATTPKLLVAVEGLVGLK